MPATTASNVHTAAIMVRRSMRSDSRPIGYCVSDGRKDAHGHESRNAGGVEPAQPRVDRAHREDEGGNDAGHGDCNHAQRCIPIKSRSRTLRGTPCSGTCREETTMATSASEISTDTIMNGVRSTGSRISSRNWAAPSPTYSTTI